MENHPIPQDVTGFQFKLIGDMTVKQFSYLATGSVFAYIFIILPIFAFIKIPIALFFFLFGVSMAFVPIEGRPMSIMFSNFIKALFTPNQYIFQKQGGHFNIFIPLPPVAQHAKTPQSQKQAVKLENYLQKLPKKAKNILDEKETVYFRSLFSPGAGLMFVTKTQSPQATPPKSKKEELKPQEMSGAEKKEDLAEEAHRVEESRKKTEEIERELKQAKLQEMLQEKTGHFSVATHEKVLELEKQLSDVVSQKESLERQLIEMQKKLTSQTQQVFSPATARIKMETPNVRKIPKGMETKLGLPFIPDTPNLIAGIVKDPRGNILPGILIEVRDKEQNPVRAFKTNPLGQFASATPLSNGTYTMEFEDPSGKNKFDSIEVIAHGEIIMPIEIVSTDEREELRKALFSNLN